MNPQKRVLAVHDLCGFGKCSLTAAIPILSAAGAEVCPMPTAVFSNHTAFPTFTLHDLTDFLLPMGQKMAEQNLAFDAIYTGYLADAAQAEITAELIRMFRKKDTLVLVDPAMADHGKLYQHLTPDFPEKMLALCSHASVIAPNLTEACLMLGVPYTPTPDRQTVEAILKGLAEKTGAQIVITSISPKEGQIGCATLDNEGSMHTFSLPQTHGMYHGTGDVFASVLCAALLAGKPLAKASEIAATFVKDGILLTEGQPSLWYGIRFEDLLVSLPERLK